MLVLTRKNEQSISVGDANGLGCLVKITVLAIGKGIVKLGFEADASVPVHRWEVWERVHTDGVVCGPAEDLDALIVK